MCSYQNGLSDLEGRYRQKEICAQGEATGNFSGLLVP